MSKSFDEKLEFLRCRGTADLAHSGHTFMDHLLGTRALLVHWEAGPEICDAGLFHAVYGTEFFGKVIVDQSDRVIVRDLIGEKAERLAWLFCCMQRERFVLEASHGAPDHIFNHATGEPAPITPDEVSALANLVVANSLEQLPRILFPWQRRERAKSLLHLRRYILPRAYAAVAAYRNAELAWRSLAVVLAIGSVVLPWFAISDDLDIGFGLVRGRESAIACCLLLSSVALTIARPEHGKKWLGLFGFAPLALLLFGMLFTGPVSRWPMAIGLALAIGAGSALLGVLAGKLATSFYLARRDS